MGDARGDFTGSSGPAERNLRDALGPKLWCQPLGPELGGGYEARGDEIDGDPLRRELLCQAQRSPAPQARHGSTHRPAGTR